MSDVDIFFKEYLDAPIYNFAGYATSKIPISEVIILPVILLYELVKPLFESLAKLGESIYLGEGKEALKNLGWFLVSPLKGIAWASLILINRALSSENFYNSVAQIYLHKATMMKMRPEIDSLTACIKNQISDLYLKFDVDTNHNEQETAEFLERLRGVILSEIQMKSGINTEEMRSINEVCSLWKCLPDEKWVLELVDVSVERHFSWIVASKQFEEFKQEKKNKLKDPIILEKAKAAFKKWKDSFFGAKTIIDMNKMLVSPSSLKAHLESSIAS